MSPLTKLMWFAHHDPRHAARRARWWVGLKDYVLPADRHARHRAVVRVGHRTARPRDARLEPAGDRAGRHRPRALPEILPTTATLPLAPAVAGSVGLRRRHAGGDRRGRRPARQPRHRRAGRASPACRSAPAARSAWPWTRRRSTPAGTLFCYALTDTIWILGGAISNGGGIVRWAGRALAPDIRDAADDDPDAAVLSWPRASRPAARACHAAVRAGRAGAALGPGPARRLPRRAPRAHARPLHPRRDRRRRACNCAPSSTAC